MKLRGLVFLILISTSARSVLAQGLSPKVLELSISEGISSFTGKSFQVGPPQSSTPIDGNMKLDANNRHEARINFLTTKRFGAEAFYYYGKTSVVFSRATAPVDSLAIPLQIHHFGLSVLYYITGAAESKWRPYVTVGGGAMLFRPSGSGQDVATDPLRGNLPSFIESSRAAVSYGAGVKRSMGKSFGLRFDAANTMASVPTFGLLQTSDLPNQNVLPVSGRVNNLHASVGIILYLGK